MTFFQEFAGKCVVGENVAFIEHSTLSYLVILRNCLLMASCTQSWFGIEIYLKGDSFPDIEAIANVLSLLRPMKTKWMNSLPGISWQNYERFDFNPSLFSHSI